MEDNTGLSELTKYPERCGQCNRQTDIVLMVVRKFNGDTACGPASDYLQKDSHDNPVPPARLKDGYRFLNWVTRCGFCYKDDLDKFEQLRIIHKKPAGDPGPNPHTQGLF